MAITPVPGACTNCGESGPVEVFGTVTAEPPAPVSRETEYIRYSDAGPTGVSAHGSHAIPAGLKSYFITVATAAGATSPTLDGVAIPAGVTIRYEAPYGDTLEAATLVTAAGDDVIFFSVS